MGKGQVLYTKAKTLIPGGTQLLSKRPEMFLPDFWPAYYSKAQGCKVWDLDGKEYIDMCFMGIGSNILGYANPDINNAVKQAVDNSSMCTLNAPEEVELAEVLTELHPWADMVRYTKSGGEAIAVAIRIARASRGKDIVLFCGYHGWSDWYLAANLSEDSALDGHLLKGLSPSGVPRGLTGTSNPFNYNNLAEFYELIEKFEGRIAAVIMEPLRNNFPEDDFLKKIRETTKHQDIILIFDEITSGFRLNCGGAHMVLGIEPDMAVFAKAISNGHAMAAIIGKKDIMNAAQGTFISSTNWTERLGLVAAIQTISKYKELNLDKHLNHVGKLVQDGWKKSAEYCNLKIEVSGINPLGHFEFCHNNRMELKTLFTQEMLKRGYLASNAFYASYSHTEEIISKYIKDVGEVFSFIKTAMDDEGVQNSLLGPVCHSGFQRLT